jgi:hypothetical protein
MHFYTVTCVIVMSVHSVAHPYSSGSFSKSRNTRPLRSLLKLGRQVKAAHRPRHLRAKVSGSARYAFSVSWGW